MKNRNKKEEKKRVFTGHKNFDYFSTKEITLERQRRILGPVHEKDERPLTEKLSHVATTTIERAKNLVIATHNCGFSFKQIADNRFKVVVL